MTEEQFWTLIETIDVSGQREESRMLAPLRRELKKMSAEALQSFHVILCEKSFQLYTPEHRS